MDGPIINPVGVMNLTKTAAFVKWTTDIAATSRIDYGTTTGYGSNVTDGTLSTRHGLQLSGLTANTTYHYKITSVDAAGNSVSSPDYTLTTRSLTYKPGDVNSDGSINTTDLSIVLSNFNKANRTFAQGNADGDLAGVVDNADLALVNQNFGT